jgi:hypothetical protein
MRRLLVTANVTSSPILVSLMMGTLVSFETSVLTRTTRRNIPGDILQRRNISPVRYKLGFYIPEDGILHSHRLENVESF